MALQPRFVARIWALTALASSLGIVCAGCSSDPAPPGGPVGVFRDYGPDVPRRGRLDSTVVDPKANSMSESKVSMWVVGSSGWESVKLDGATVVASGQTEIDAKGASEAIGPIEIGLEVDSAANPPVLKVTLSTQAWSLSDKSEKSEAKVLATGTVELKGGPFTLKPEFATDSVASGSEFVVARVLGKNGKDAATVSFRGEGSGRGTR
jgi:hypothetical protein